MQKLIIPTYFPMNLTPRKLFNFEELEEKARIQNAYFFQNNKVARTRMLASPPNFDPVEVVLYYGGTNNVISVKNFQQMFAYEGLQVIQKPAPSLLVDACNVLTEAKLVELGLSHDVNIALLTDYKENGMFMTKGHHCSMELTRSEGYRKFTMTCVFQEWVNYAFLLCKTK